MGEGHHPRPEVHSVRDHESTEDELKRKESELDAEREEHLRRTNGD